MSHQLGEEKVGRTEENPRTLHAPQRLCCLRQPKIGLGSPVLRPAGDTRSVVQWTDGLASSHPLLKVTRSPSHATGELQHPQAQECGHFVPCQLGGRPGPSDTFHFRSAIHSTCLAPLGNDGLLIARTCIQHGVGGVVKHSETFCF
jgi:hypothetical protein